MTTNRNGHAQLFLPGIVVITRNAAGDQVIKVKEIADWLTVLECCERVPCCEEVIYALCDDGTLTWKWKNFEGAGGTKLIHAGSFQMWLDARTRTGRLHPQFAFR